MGQMEGFTSSGLICADLSSPEWYLFFLLYGKINSCSDRNSSGEEINGIGVAHCQSFLTYTTATLLIAAQ